MTRWQQEIEVVSDSIPNDILAKRGTDGWELVGYTAPDMSSQRPYWVFAFKRPEEPEAP